MPLRHSKRIHYCELCEKRARETCTRCGRHFCEQHNPAHDQACESCEADFVHRADALTRPLPKPLKGAFKVTVAYPSLGLGVLGAFLTMMATVGGAGLAAFGYAFYAFVIGTVGGLMVTLPLYLVFGTPIFARRKLMGATQKARLALARHRFDKERRALPPPDPKTENDDVSVRD